jgi:hypothetical protein
MTVVSQKNFGGIQHIRKFGERCGSQWAQVSIEMWVIVKTCHNYV